MGEPMEPTAQPSPATPTPTIHFLLSKNALDASRTEILVMAAGILFLASQVCLLVWILRRTGRYAAPREKEHRKVAIVLPAETKPPSLPTADAHDGNVAILTSSSTGKVKSILRLRHHSSWGGRSAQPGSHDPQGRRKSVGLPGKVQDNSDDDSVDDEERNAGAQTSLSSPGPGPKPNAELEGGRGALTELGDAGRMAAEPATPTTLPLPGSGGGEGGEGAEHTELKEFDAGRAWDVAGLLAASIEKPGPPRSPRMLAADQAAMMDALCAEGKEGKGDWKADARLPVVGAELDAPALAFGFEDPLGANRMLDLPGQKEEGHEAVELEARDGGRRDVGG